MLGRKFTKEHREKLSKATKSAWKSGLHKNNPTSSGRPAWNRKPRKVKMIECACGCGETLNMYDSKNRQRKSIKGHLLKKMSIESRGKPKPPHVIESLRISNIGREPWNKGKKGVMPTPWNKGKNGEYKLPNVSRKLKGRRNSPRTEFQKGLRPWNTGLPSQEQPNWQNGGTRKIRRAIESLKLYSDWRNTIRERDNYTCQICDKYGGRLEIDHHPVALQQLIGLFNIKTSEGAIACPEIWDTSNGRVLCYKCHKKHTGIQMSKKGRLDLF